MWAVPTPLTFLILVGGIGGRGRIEMVATSTPSANKPAKDLILVHRVQLRPMIKAHFLGRMVSSGISDVAFASVYSLITLLKKLMMKIIIIGERAKRARHSQVCSIENRGYIYYI